MSDQCEALLDRLETFLDGECPQDVQASIEEHLQLCPPCLDRADFERRVRDLVARKCRDRAPAGLIDAIKLKLELG